MLCQDGKMDIKMYEVSLTKFITLCFCLPKSLEVNLTEHWVRSFHRLTFTDVFRPTSC